MRMKHRVYVAITFPAEVQEQMLSVSRKHDLPVRWIEGRNLHITLVPPWHTSDLEDVKQRLDRLKKHNPFTISFNRVLFGPDPRNPRLIWAEGPTTKKILELQEHVESALGAHDERMFRLHVTLARFKAEDFKEFPKELDEEVDWQVPVRSIALMESRLLPQGAQYDILHEVRFQPK
jgi:RNA 2',3'-cyclic 3'-phosphodiesterase